jgi:hypothetical protein
MHWRSFLSGASVQHRVDVVCPSATVSVFVRGRPTHLVNLPACAPHLLISGQSQQFESYTLSNGSLTRSRDGTHIQVDVANFDLNEVKRLTSLLTVVNTSYAAAQNGTIADLLGNDLTEVPTINALQARNFGPDTVRPQLVFSMLNVSGTIGVVLLEFDETMRASSFDPTAIVLQSAQNGSASSTTSFRLTGGSVASIDSTQMIFALLPSDLNSIKRLSNLATTNLSTFFSFSANACEDMSNNSAVPVSTTTGRAVDAFLGDVTAPELTACGLDLTRGQLQLNFSETVNSNSFQPQFVSIVSGLTPTAAEVTLGAAGTHVNSSNFGITITFSADDLNAIKSNVELAVSQATVFCALPSSTSSSSAVRDMVDIPVASISPANGLAATQYQADNELPQLVNFSIDLNTEELFLTFSEVVNVSSLQVHRITFSSRHRSQQQIYSRTPTPWSLAFSYPRQTSTRSKHTTSSFGTFQPRSSSFIQT